MSDTETSVRTSERAMTMPLFESKLTTIEAVQWTGDNFEALAEFAGEKVSWPGPADSGYDGDNPAIILLAGQDGAQGWVPVPVGHWLVNQPGDKTDIWPVDADYFAGKYQPADA